MPDTVEGQLAFELRHVARLFRAGSRKRQVSPQDVQNLGKLIEVGLPEPSAKAGDPRIPGLCPLRASAGNHRSKLENVEHASVSCDTRLPIEEWPAICEVVSSRDQRDNQQENHHAYRAGTQVDKAFGSRIAGPVQL